MTLRALADFHGIATSYDDRHVPDATLRLILDGLGIDPDGLKKGPRAAKHMPSLSVRAPKPARGWGVFCQLYELRSRRNWGIGDFADLARLAEICGAEGADFIGVNPLHALFLSAPERCSPFSPSNRRFLNPLYIAPDLLGLDRPDIPHGDLVDYEAVTDTKLTALRTVFDESEENVAFALFVETQGEPLRLHALFEVISALHGGTGWKDWPDNYRHRHDKAVAAIARFHSDDIRFYQWLQWIAREQLSAAQRAAIKADMRIGLYLDLAVGEAQDGSATWSGTAAALPNLDVGAPPDMFSEGGQNWHLAAPSPTEMAAGDFANYRAMISAQLRDAGALRIDHAMALWQLFLIPSGRPASEGAHLRYPMADLLRVLTEEANAANAVLIGEDLGFVPEGFHEVMDAANVLSYRIVYFEQDQQGFYAADAYPSTALACLSTHDLPVLAAWWRGDDIDLREANGLVSKGASIEHRAHRKSERESLIQAIKLRVDAAAPVLPDAVLNGTYSFIAKTNSVLAGVRLADLTGPETPTNLPGVVDEHPNWRPRSPVDIADIARHPSFVRVTEIMRKHR